MGRGGRPAQPSAERSPGAPITAATTRTVATLGICGMMAGTTTRFANLTAAIVVAVTTGDIEGDCFGQAASLPQRMAPIRNCAQCSVESRTGAQPASIATRRATGFERAQTEVAAIAGVVLG